MKNIKYIILIFLINLSFSSCTLNDDTDKDKITGGSQIIGWAHAKVSENYFEDLGTITKQYPINIQGGDDIVLNKDVNYTISVNEEETTAVNGEYNLPTLTGTINVGEAFGDFPIEINTFNFSGDAPTKLVMDLSASVDGVVVNSKTKSITVNFVGCLSNLADFSYMVTIVRDDGDTYGPVLETLTEESINKFMTYSVGSWSSPLNPGHGVRFEDICGTLTIPDQKLADMYGNDVVALSTSTVDENGNFELKYTISFDDGATLLKHTATYVKQ